LQAPRRRGGFLLEELFPSGAEAKSINHIGAFKRISRLFPSGVGSIGLAGKVLTLTKSNHIGIGFKGR
jgi:hypothetical protein